MQAGIIAGIFITVYVAWGCLYVRAFTPDAPLQGVPIRLELGPKDMENQSVMLARRDTGVKETVAWADVAARVPELLEQIQVRP